MNLKKFLIVFGTRPEAIKMAPLINALRAEASEFEIKVCITAQHRMMLDQVMQIFNISPDIDLDLMKSGQDLFDITSSVLLGMRKVFSSHTFDAVLVHGDTTTTLASALAGFYAGVPIGHVEAGLRTHNVFAPFPEEFNRQVVSKLARWHFTPTGKSRDNLLAEGVDPTKIIVTGNTVIDALHWVLERIETDPSRSLLLNSMLERILPFDWKNKRFILITGHRRENFGIGFLQICEAISELALTFEDVHFVYPVHLNPNVQQPVQSLLSQLPNVHLIAPLGYEPFVYLLKHAFLVLTDSGGIQEEAPSLGKPVLVMREVTERPEALQAGAIKLVGADKTRIIAGVTRLLEDEMHYKSMSCVLSPYGDGHASRRIVETLKNFN